MPLTIFLFTLLGLAFGSFGNVLILRLERGESLLGRSRCKQGKHALGVLDLIPVLSYALLGGRCRTCGCHISIQYPIIEILSAALFALSAALYPSYLFIAILTAFLLYALLLSAAYDVLHQRLPDFFVDGVAVPALLLTYFTGTIFSSLLGLAIVLVWFGGQWVLSKGRAVGTGDIFLSSALALWLGFRGTIAMLLFSYIAGAIITLLLLGLGKISMKQKRIAFGPFLAIGAFLAFLGVGQELLRVLIPFA